MTIVRGTYNLGQSALARTPLGRLCSHRPLLPTPLLPCSRETEFRFRFPTIAALVGAARWGDDIFLCYAFYFPFCPCPCQPSSSHTPFCRGFFYCYARCVEQVEALFDNNNNNTSSSSSSNNNYNNNNSISNW